MRDARTEGHLEISRVPAARRSVRALAGQSSFRHVWTRQSQVAGQQCDKCVREEQDPNRLQGGAAPHRAIRDIAEVRRVVNQVEANVGKGTASWDASFYSRLVEAFGFHTVPMLAKLGGRPYVPRMPEGAGHIDHIIGVLSPVPHLFALAREAVAFLRHLLRGQQAVPAVDPMRFIQPAGWGGFPARICLHCDEQRCAGCIGALMEDDGLSASDAITSECPSEAGPYAVAGQAIGQHRASVQACSHQDLVPRSLKGLGEFCSGSVQKGEKRRRGSTAVSQSALPAPAPVWGGALPVVALDGASDWRCPNPSCVNHERRVWHRLQECPRCHSTPTEIRAFSEPKGAVSWLHTLFRFLARPWLYRVRRMPGKVGDQMGLPTPSPDEHTARSGRRLD